MDHELAGFRAVRASELGPKWPTSHWPEAGNWHVHFGLCKFVGYGLCLNSKRQAFFDAQTPWPST